MFGRGKGSKASEGDLAAQVIEWRRWLHENAERSYEEHETTDYVASVLEDMGLKVHRFDMGTGLWCDVPAADGASSKDVVGLRADIDALPMAEDTGLDFASANEGVSHACGHDAHTAMLLGAASLLVADPPPQPVRLIFQPAEETQPGGAKKCVEEGVTDGLTQLMGLHCDPHRPTGEVGVIAGPITSSNANFGITVTSSGGHTARPHETGDTIFAAAQIVTGLTAALDRRVDPRAGAVLTFGSINGGSAVNVIPAKVEMWGTLRSAKRDVWEIGEELVTTSVASIAATFGVEAEVTYTQGPPPVINDEECAERARAAVVSVFGEEGVGTAEQSSGGDDFSWYLDSVPGVYLRFGVHSGKGEETDLHHPGFLLDEDALADGARLFDAFARG